MFFDYHYNKSMTFRNSLEALKDILRGKKGKKILRQEFEIRKAFEKKEMFVILLF